MKAVNIVQSILTENPCYKEGKEIEPKGIMLHSVRCSQPSAKVLINNWNRPTYTRACGHAFIDANDGAVYQTLPWCYRGWHCMKSGNDTHIGIFMCEPAQIKYTSDSKFTVADANYNVAYRAVKRAYDSAVELCAMLCEKFGFDPMTDIISNKEAASKGIASNHPDPEHLWSGMKMKYTMDEFRKDVNAAMKKSHNGSETTENPENESFKVKVKVGNLNIRTGPGNDCPVTGRFTGIGVFTISKISSGPGSEKGWGQLSDDTDHGWIALDYVTKL